MVRRVTISLFFLILFFPRFSNAQQLWQRQDRGLGDIDVRSISVFSGDHRFICAACAHSVYFSQNYGDFWQEAFSLKGEGSEINFVTFDPVSPEILYLATTEGLYVTENRGRDWKRVFRKVGETANNVAWIALDLLDERKIYIGTGKGLYASSDSGQTWGKRNGWLPQAPVGSIAVHPSNSQVLYLANTYGLFKSVDKGYVWKRIYVTSPKITDDEDAEDDEESSQEEENRTLISCIAIDKGSPEKVFIATGEGVFVSSDSGESWNKLPQQGLSCDDVNFIVASSNKEGAVYAATKKGVFEFLPGLSSWQEIYQGMSARDVRALALNADSEQLFAATNRGVFKTVDTATPGSVNNEHSRTVEIDSVQKQLEELSLNEPTIQEVQEAALRYAEVIHPQRIKTLRQNAKLKALFPDVSVDYDKTIQSGGTGGNFGAFVVGPRDWGFSLSWDVGDMVFNEQVRLLDGNARLMVQLRDDILNEVTGLYYQRRKLQIELMMSPPENPQERIAKRLRLEELTANIDALTGGYFSGNVKTQIFLD